jgi:hypothetical protein
MKGNEERCHVPGSTSRKIVLIEKCSPLRLPVHVLLHEFRIFLREKATLNKEDNKAKA